MKKAFFSLLFFTVLSLVFSQDNIINLERDNPNTLIGSSYLQFRVFGLSVNMTHEQAWERINSDSRIYGEDDRPNPGRIYVYDARNRKCILYLIWNQRENRMASMTVFNDCSDFLSSSFKRLLTLEAINGLSSFLGNSNRSRETLNISSIGVLYTTYYYDDIGIQITHQKDSNGERVVFSFGRNE